MSVVLSLLTQSCALMRDRSREAYTSPEYFDLRPTQKLILKMRANKGDANAAFRLAQYYLYTKYDRLAFVQWCERAANLGHPNAIRILPEVRKRMTKSAVKIKD